MWLYWGDSVEMGFRDWEGIFWDVLIGWCWGWGVEGGDFFRGGWNYMGCFLKFSSLHRIKLTPLIDSLLNMPPYSSIHLMVVI